ncbi:uncharacterized protein [Symphalangus syndactylus]|uniref:uncharacterized protein isoform X2 n=1 Tax=Symphalangus syndactylus TaxID=9590 RepID=UPI003007A298
MEGHASIVPISQGRSKARRGQSSSQMAHARPMLPALTHSSGPALKRRGVWKFCPIPAAGESASWVPRLPQHPLRPMPTRPAHENPGHSGDCGRNFWVSRWSSPRRLPSGFQPTPMHGTQELWVPPLHEGSLRILWRIPRYLSLPAHRKHPDCRAIPVSSWSPQHPAD